LVYDNLIQNRLRQSNSPPALSRKNFGGEGAIFYFPTLIISREIISFIFGGVLPACKPFHSANRARLVPRCILTEAPRARQAYLLRKRTVKYSAKYSCADSIAPPLVYQAEKYSKNSLRNLSVSVIIYFVSEKRDSRNAKDF
jgi:hypothetical protein